MDIKESTQDGNIEVVETLLCRGGVGEPADKWFKEGKDIDILEHVILFHGNLLTKERLDSVQDSWRIEKTPRWRFQQVILLLGLFHLDMACVNESILVNAFAGKKIHTDPNSLFRNISILRPKEIGKFTSNPGY
jgi:hypothetical protein